ncbi:MAG TPA: PAS domain S-box protein [Polyangiaceae bacterium]|jgi:PAS domain S-box-containing protein
MPNHGSAGASEEIFRLLVESVRDYAIFMLDPTGHVQTWNVGAERLKWWKANEIIGQHFSVFYEPHEAASGKCEYELEMAARDGRFEDEGWRVRKDGTRFWANVVITALRNASGQLVGFAKVTRDLTERRNAENERVRRAQAEEAARVERALRHSIDEARRWFETTLRSIGDAVIATDTQGVVTLMNPVAERLTGLTADEARGRPLRDVFHIVNETTQKPIESPVDRVLREGVVVGLANHTALVRPDGAHISIADSGAPIRDEAGEIRGVVLVFRDATPETRASERRAFMMDVAAALGSSLDYKATLMRLAKLAVPSLSDWCAVYIVDDDGKARNVANAHIDPAKLKLAHEIGERFPQRTNASRGVPEVIRTGRSQLYPHVDDQLLAVTAESPEHMQMTRALGIRSAMIVPLTTGGRVLGAISFIFADSGRAYDEDALSFAEELGRRAGVAVENARLYTAEQRARESADAANRAKDEFLAAVSHELRTPLTAILGWSKMLRAHTLQEVQRIHANEIIERNAVTMTQLIEDLLDVSRIVSGKMRIDVHTTEIAPIVEAALDSVKPAADAKAIVIERDLDRLPALVAGDAARLQQIVWNLVSNAVKFSPRGGRVRVASRTEGDTLEFVVSDRGKGIPPRFLPYVFEPFRQADGGIARMSGGLGLGLAITKHLVELHGGTIEAKSEGEGKGATFTVRLPIAESLRVPATEPRRAPPQLDGLRVLTVDDEEDARQLVQVVLEHAGAKVRTAGSAREALDAMKNEVPDVLLSDIGMPGETGYDLIRSVRSLPPNAGGNVPAAALTAYARAEDRNRALGAGFMMHVPKPIDPSELVSVVGTLARIKSAM